METITELLMREYFEGDIHKYKKKPVEIEAIQWNGDNLKEILYFTGVHPSARNLTLKQFELLVEEEGLKIFTLEGHHKASIGDFIIKGVAGEFYPCKPDIFAETYNKS